MSEEKINAFLERRGYIEKWLRLNERTKRKGQRLEGLDGTWVGTFLTPDEWAPIAREYDNLEASVREECPQYAPRRDGSLPLIHPKVRKPNAVENATWYTATSHEWIERSPKKPPFRVIDIRAHGRCKDPQTGATTPFRRRIREGLGVVFVGEKPPRYKFPTFRRKRSDRKPASN
jgi:hypothetical protein